MIREGQEDYEYLRMAEQKVGRAAVLKAMAPVMTAATKYTHEALEIYDKALKAEPPWSDKTTIHRNIAICRDVKRTSGLLGGTRIQGHSIGVDRSGGELRKG